MVTDSKTSCPRFFIRSIGVMEMVTLWILQLIANYRLHSLAERSARLMHLGLFVCLSVRIAPIDVIFYTRSVVPVAHTSPKCGMLVNGIEAGQRPHC